MTEVLVKLRDHYSAVHRINMINDDSLENMAAASSGPGKAPKKKVITAPRADPTAIIEPLPVTMIQQLPKVPLTHVQLSIKADQIQPLILAQLSPFSEARIDSTSYDVTTGETTDVSLLSSHHITSKSTTTTPLLQHETTHSKGSSLSSSSCSSKVMAKSEHELHTFGTSLLRPEAAAHKVHNSSRKPKHVVIAELWRHYLQFHAKELTMTMTMASNGSVQEEMGWVGSVEDDDEDK